MASLNKRNVKIQYIFEKDTSEGLLRSALYFSPSEYETITDKEIEIEIQKQSDSWVENIILAKEEDAKEYTPEELLKLKQELEAQIAELETQKQEVETILNA